LLLIWRILGDLTINSFVSLFREQHDLNPVIAKSKRS